MKWEGALCCKREDGLAPDEGETYACSSDRIVQSIYTMAHSMQASLANTEGGTRVLVFKRVYLCALEARYVEYGEDGLSDKRHGVVHEK